MSPGQESDFERRVSQQSATQPIISALYTVRFGPLRAKYSLDREHPPLTNARASEQNSKERETHSRTSSKHPKLRQTTVVHKVRTLLRPPASLPGPDLFPGFCFPRMLKPSVELASRRPKPARTRAKAGDSSGSSSPFNLQRIRFDRRVSRRRWGRAGIPTFRGFFTAGVGKSGCDIRSAFPPSSVGSNRRVSPGSARIGRILAKNDSSSRTPPRFVSDIGPFAADLRGRGVIHRQSTTWPTAALLVTNIFFWVSRASR